MAKSLSVVPIRVSIHQVGDSPLFGESATWVELQDEGGGPYLRISQPSMEDGRGGVLITRKELPLLLAAADMLGLTPEVC